MRRIELALSCGLATGCAASAIAQPLFQGLGDLPGGEFVSRAAAISGDGSTVVGNSWSANGPEAFAWRVEQGLAGMGDLDDGAFPGGKGGHERGIRRVREDSRTRQPSKCSGDVHRE